MYSMICQGYICNSKWSEGLRLQQWHVIIHKIYLLGHSCSQFWPMLHSYNAQIWFKETGNPGENCGWDNWGDGAFNRMELSGPLWQKAHSAFRGPELQPLQCIYVYISLECTVPLSNQWELECCRNLIGQSCTSDSWLQNDSCFLTILLQFSTVQIIV